MLDTLPEQLEKYAETPIFTQQSVPEKLTNLHDTKVGVWGKLKVHTGCLMYVIPGPPHETKLVSAGDFAVIEPSILHKVDMVDDVSFSIEFHRQKN